MPKHKISHIGVVDTLERDEVVVKITSYAACSSCHARGACNVTGENEKYMRIKAGPSGFRPGQNVKVILDQSLGFRALFLGYVLPFLIVLITLLILTAAGTSELMAGAVSLAVLLPYYGGLRLLRGRIERRFTFLIDKA